MHTSFGKPPAYQLPDAGLKIHTIDAHTEGEPLRIIWGGFPEPAGHTVLERRRAAQTMHDPLRTALMWEPRGHADMYGCLLLPPCDPLADFGVLFLHNEGYSTMCGHAIIAVTTVILETGLWPMHPPKTRLRIETPAGLVTADARIEKGRVTSVYFHNVPSYVAALDAVVAVPELGQIRYDLAFGGAYYAYVNAADVGLTCAPESTQALIEAGMHIKRAVMAQHPITHPTEADLGFLYGTIFLDAPEDPAHHSRNVCIFAEGEVDRCPTGTGVSGRLAIHHARGDIQTDERIQIESILGTTFTGRVVETTTFGPHPAIIPEVEGTAFITGQHTFYLDPNDPLRNGFLLR